MDGCALENERNGTLSAFGDDALGVAEGAVGLGEITRGAATAQTTSTSDRLPQTGLIYPIFFRKRFQHYSSLEGDHRP